MSKSASVVYIVTATCVQAFVLGRKREKRGNHFTSFAITKTGHLSSRPRQVTTILLSVERERGGIPAFGLVIDRKTDGFQIGYTAQLAIAEDKSSLSGIFRINVHPEHDLHLERDSRNTVKKGLS